MGAAELEWLDIVGRLVLAAALGGALGIEREYDGQDAGFRTHMLVVLGAALFGVVSVGAFDDFIGARGSTNVNIDITRIAAYVAPGIGFIGGGAILKYGGRVTGVTTAASLWSAAAVGVAAGVGFWVGAVAATAVALVALEGLRPVGERVTRLGRRRRASLRLELAAPTGLERLVSELHDRSRGGQIRELRYGVGADEGAEVTIEYWEDPPELDRVAASLAELPGVLTVTARPRR